MRLSKSLEIFFIHRQFLTFQYRHALDSYYRVITLFLSRDNEYPKFFLVRINELFDLIHFVRMIFENAW